MILTISVALSEFADSLSFAFVLLGIYLLLFSSADERKRSFIAGILVGLSYLLRFHYLISLIIIPLAWGLVKPREIRPIRSLTFFFIGFCIGAIPIITLNLIVYGVPLSTGFSQYMPGQYATHSLDWKNFLGTYNTWPLKRLLAERPFEFVQLINTNITTLAKSNYLAGIFMVLILLVTKKESEIDQRKIAFFLLIFVMYVALTILPTQYSDRGFYPGFIIMAILVGAIFKQKIIMSARIGRLALSITLLIAFYLIGQSTLLVVKHKRNSLAYNQDAVEFLREQGVVTGSQVFTNNTNFYNFNDPYFEPFYNYGEYMLLDSEYERLRPIPHADTLDEWETFVVAHGIRYGGFFKGIPTPGIPIGDFLMKYKLIYQDKRVDIYSFI
jgi:hypothetical protein